VVRTSTIANSFERNTRLGSVKHRARTLVLVCQLFGAGMKSSHAGNAGSSDNRELWRMHMAASCFGVSELCASAHGCADVDVQPVLDREPIAWSLYIHTLTCNNA